MDRSATRMTVTLSLVAIVCLLASVRGKLMDDESIEDRYLKRSLCNTFGGCSGFETGLRFTGRSFSDKETGRSPAHARPPYSFNYASKRTQPYGQQYAVSRNQQHQADDLRELPTGWTMNNRGYQGSTLQGPAFDNNIR